MVSKPTVTKSICNIVLGGAGGRGTGEPTGEPGYYSSFQYPAGETQVRLNENYIEDIQNALRIRILARIHSAQDILELAGLCDAIKGCCISPDIQLVLPYGPYLRADRRFVRGDCVGIAVFGKLLSAMGIKSLVTLDAHSQIGLAKLRQYLPVLDVSPYELILSAVRKFAVECKASTIGVLFPDEGAAARYHLPESIELTRSNQVKITYYSATKHRDPSTGALSHFSVPGEISLTLPILIVDDICDGGATFIGVSKALADISNCGEHGLYVTHGIFSKGLGELLDYFNFIYSTNSFSPTYMLQGSPAGMSAVTMLDCMPTLLEAATRA